MDINVILQFVHMRFIHSLFFACALLRWQVRNSQVTQVSKTSFMTPSAFIFLYENQLFLTFKGQGVAVWNFRGELVTQYVERDLN